MLPQIEPTSERVLIAIFVLFAVLIWEALAPRRRRVWSRIQRWPSNLALGIIGSIVLRAFLPLGAVSVAQYVQEHGWGLFAYWNAPSIVKNALTLVTFDFAIYWQHRLTHRLPWLWRLHLVHHADEDVDGTTALRFHPLEILFSMIWKSLLIVILGPKAEAILLFEVLLNASAIFNHANARLPNSIERWLRLIIVTPDMHRVHHSSDPGEEQRNFGFNLSLWDRLAGSYQSDPKGNPDTFPLGLSPLQNDKKTTRLGWQLIAPFLTCK